MRPKHKALMFNFIGFAILFIITRIILGHFFSFHRIILAITAFVIANLLAPKFVVVTDDGNEKIIMKWLFIKDFREL